MEVERTGSRVEKMLDADTRESGMAWDGKCATYDGQELGRTVNIFWWWRRRKAHGGHIPVGTRATALWD